MLPQVPGVRLDQQIGRGGYATVYRGRQLSVDRDVAVKVDDRRLLDERDRRRFTREIVAAGAVSAHPHIVTVYDGGTTAEAHPYLVMELYPGGSYSDRMRSGGPVPPGEVLDVGIAIADALAVAHADGILHRDVKPGNILISRYGTAALADFGLAALPRAAEGYSVTMESLTPSYAPPEAFGGAEPTAAMDVYSLGATLYALLQGRAPRSDASGSAPPLIRLLFLLNEPLPDPGIPGAQALMTVIWRATAFDPSDRYPTAAAMRDDLVAIRAGRPMSSGRASTGRPAPDGSDPGSTQAAGDAGNRSGRWWWVGAAAVVAVLLVAGLVVFRHAGSTAGVAQAGVAAAAPGASATPPTTSSPTVRSGLPLETRLGGLRTASAGTARPGAGTSSPATPARTIPSTATPATTTPATNSGSANSGSTNSGSTTVSTRTSVRPTAVAPPTGSCWSGLVDISGTKTASEVPCASAHYWETYATGVLDPATATPYDDDVAKDPVVARTCTRAALTAYLGPGRKGSFDVDVVPPRELAFSSGQKGFWCVVSVPGAGEVTGSIRNR